MFELFVAKMRLYENKKARDAIAFLTEGIRKPKVRKCTAPLQVPSFRTEHTKGWQHLYPNL